MKTISICVLSVLLGSLVPLPGQEPLTNPPPAESSVAAQDPAPPAPAAPAAELSTNAPVLLPNGEPGLRLNFRGVPLDLVLDYLSEAAGFIVVLDTKVTGKIDAWSNKPLSQEEAVNLLNSALNRNGFAAIRNGRTLTIVNKDEAKTRHIPVILESDPDKIPRTDEMVTQIIPVRYIEVTQLVKDLQPLVSTSTTMTANEAGNSLILTDTRANINRVAQIIQAIDQGAEEVTELRVFHLEFADPTEMATLLSGLFPDSSSSGSQASMRFGGRGGGFPDFFGRGGRDSGSSSSSSGAQSERVKKRARVLAVADPRTSSVIVSAVSGLMGQVEEMIRQLDANPAKKQKVYVFEVNPGDVSQIQQVLEDMFESSSNNRNSRNNSSQQNTALQNRATQNQQTGNSNNRNTTTRNSNRSGNIGGGF